VVLLAACGALSSCSAWSARGAPAGTVGAPAGPGGPSIASVARGRFVHEVVLDGGDFVVQPPGDVTARLSRSKATPMFDAADAVVGTYPLAVLGLGIVTISTSVPSAPDAAGSAAAAATVPGASASTSSPSATTTSSSVTTTTAAAPTTSTLAPSGTTPGAPASVPRYAGRLAWVGMAWSPCTSSSGRADGARVVAVVFDAQSGHDALSFKGVSGHCAGVTDVAQVSRPEELESVPWQPVGPSSTAVTITLPACGSYYGWTELGGQGAGAVQVVARRPFDPQCSPATGRTQTVDDVVPLGDGQRQVAHAPLGLVDALRSLPAG
jgi:hypothetical protein